MHCLQSTPQPNVDKFTQIIIIKLKKISSPSKFLDFIGSETGSHDIRVQINKSIFRHVTIFMFHKTIHDNWLNEL